VRFTRRLYQRFRVLIHEAAKFGVVGLVGFIVSLGGADVLYFDAGVGKYKAVVAATIAATVVTFLGNRYWAFRHRERVGMGRETVLFFVFNAIGLAIQLACVAIVVDGAGLQGKIWYNLANLCGIGLGTLFRFWSYRKWVWRTQEPASGVPASGHRPVSPAPGSPEAGVVEAVAVGLDEEATLYGRGAENYDGAEGYGAEGYGAESYGTEGYGAESYGGGAETYGRPEGNGPGTGNHGRGPEGTDNGTRPAGPRHAAKQR
jgi:putative flippase GtrA